MTSSWLLRLLGLLPVLLASPLLVVQGRTPLMATAMAQDVTVQLAADGTATLAAVSVNNGSTGSGTLTCTIQKIVYGVTNENNTLTLATPTGVTFSAIRYASFGNPVGTNGNYTLGTCNASSSVTVVSNELIGSAAGSIAATNTNFGGDPCSGVYKYLAIQAAYSSDAATQPYTCADVAGPNYVLLTVTDNSGSSSTATAKVTVVAPPTASIINSSPNIGTIGTLVTLVGTNLGGVLNVTVNGTAATIASAAANALTFRIPVGATSGNVVIGLPCSQSLSTTFTVVAPLPVQLVSFTVQPLERGMALAWHTTSEMNSARFEVERSPDGLGFTLVGSVPATGTSLTPHAYAYLDTQLPTGAKLLYYRLRQVDLDGRASYSSVLAVALRAEGLMLYPNPAGHVVKLSGAEAGALVQVYNVLGSLVFTGRADVAGTAMLELPASLPSGLYLVRSGAVPTLHLTVE